MSFAPWSRALVTWLLVAVACLAGPAPARAAATDLPRLVALQVSPAAPIASEVVRFAGQLPDRGRRPVRLERWVGDRWATAVSAWTSEGGAFALRTRAAATPGTRWAFRVVAPRWRADGVRSPRVVTSSRGVRSVGQTGALSAQTSTPAGKTFSTTLTFTPARPGRPVRLQRLLDTGWRSVAVGAQSRTGTATLDAPGIAAGRARYRAVTYAADGARTVISAARSVVAVATPVIITRSLPGATTGAAYTQGLHVVGRPAGSWSWASSSTPPDWLTLDAATGALTGSPGPEDVGAAKLAVTFTDGFGRTATRTITLTTRAADSDPHNDWSSLAGGMTATCGLKHAGTLWCWGSTGADTAVAQVGSEGDWTSIAVGSGHRCGLKTDGSVWCWGDNKSGQAGQRVLSTADGWVDDPTRVGSRNDWTAVDAGGSSTCALRVDGSAWCWGSNEHGVLGSPTGAGSPAPQPLPLRVDGSGWTAIDLGHQHACGLRQDGSAWCWGSNEEGALGDQDGLGTRDPRPNPTQVAAGSTWVEIVTTFGASCARSTGGEVWCWGEPIWAPSNIPHPEPVRIGGETTFSDVAGGGSQACALVTSGAVWCWGINNGGETGTPPHDGHPDVPGAVGSDTDWVALGLGDFHSCGLRAGGTAWCWGTNNFDVLGFPEDGEDHYLPVQVGVGPVDPED